MSTPPPKAAQTRKKVVMPGSSFARGINSKLTFPHVFRQRRAPDGAS